jgi:hypothetical protein
MTKDRRKDSDPIIVVDDCIDDVDRARSLGWFYRHNAMHAGTTPMKRRAVVLAEDCRPTPSRLTPKARSNASWSEVLSSMARPAERDVADLGANIFRRRVLYFFE